VPYKPKLLTWASPHITTGIPLIAMWTDRQPLRTLSPTGTRRAKQPCAPCGAEPDALADLGCSAPSASWDQADLCRVSSRRATHAVSSGESPCPRRVVAATGSAWCPNQTGGGGSILAIAMLHSKNQSALQPVSKLRALYAATVSSVIPSRVVGKQKTVQRHGFFPLTIERTA
jgi:hypothetical protein